MYCNVGVHLASCFSVHWTSTSWKQAKCSPVDIQNEYLYLILKCYHCISLALLIFKNAYLTHSKYYTETLLEISDVWSEYNGVFKGEKSFLEFAISKIKFESITSVWMLIKHPKYEM